MIARHRGALRAHSRWLPSTAATLPRPAGIEDDDLLRRQPDVLPQEQQDLDLPRGSRRKASALIALATIVAIAVIAGQQYIAPDAAGAALAVHPTAMGVSVDRRDAPGSRRGLRLPICAGARTRI